MNATRHDFVIIQKKSSWMHNEWKVQQRIWNGICIKSLNLHSFCSWKQLNAGMNLKRTEKVEIKQLTREQFCE